MTLILKLNLYPNNFASMCVSIDLVRTGAISAMDFKHTYYFSHIGIQKFGHEKFKMYVCT